MLGIPKKKKEAKSIKKRKKSKITRSNERI